MTESEDDEPAAPAAEFKVTHGTIVNLQVLGDMLGVSRPTVERYIKAGMPVESRGSRTVAWRLNTAAAVNWLVQRAANAASGGAAVASNMDDAKLREKLAMAELREYQVAEKRGTLVHVDAVRQAVEADYAVVKSKIGSLPARISGKVTDPEIAEQVERDARKEVHEILAELVVADVVLDAQLSGDV